MAKEVNLLDPLGIATAVRGQINQMAVQANLPQVPNVPTIKVKMDYLPLLNQFNLTPERPGWSRGERAG